jgi:hypothetical protein
VSSYAAEIQRQKQLLINNLMRTSDNKVARLGQAGNDNGAVNVGNLIRIELIAEVLVEICREF